MRIKCSLVIPHHRAADLAFEESLRAITFIGELFKIRPQISLDIMTDIDETDLAKIREGALAPGLRRMLIEPFGVGLPTHVRNPSWCAAQRSNASRFSSR